MWQHDHRHGAGIDVKQIEFTTREFTISWDGQGRNLWFQFRNAPRREGPQNETAQTGVAWRVQFQHRMGPTGNESDVGGDIWANSAGDCAPCVCLSGRLQQPRAALAHTAP
jgi:hypothetical protein